ncbi:DNA repair protein RadA [candidate division KSB1 bacterium]|nr:MAG: DNA repair protein RadA [candidate division KSB1 bacterium]
MKKQRTKYVCQSCGYTAFKWLGRCPECGNWNTFVEELETGKTKGKNYSKNTISPVSVSSITEDSYKRLITGIDEFDRVLGGGIVPGSVVLIGGEPGIGKSTLLLQVCDSLVKKNLKVLYISGEESLSQIKSRAARTGINSENLFLAAETDTDAVCSFLEKNTFDLVIIDSIQTVYSDNLDSMPGNISQVRYSGHKLTSVAKDTQIPVILIGHVNKEGSLAGPRVLEHLVDVLILMEGDNNYFRLLRPIKNRFGSTQEVGIFEMTGSGLKQVLNPSEFLASHHEKPTSGTVVTASLEGTRSLLVEVQALVAQTNYGVPQRTVSGIDQRRLSIILAVLEKSARIHFGSKDVFATVAGGLKINEPSVDLAVACAVVSSYFSKPLDLKTVVVGEIGLTGEIRGVSGTESRIKEAERLGYETIVLPEQNVASLNKDYKKIRIIGKSTLKQVINELFGK